MQNFAISLNRTMNSNKLNRAIAHLRHLNPEMYKIINDLWINQTGKNNLFKLRFILVYINNHLDEYLSMCEKRFIQIENGDADKGEANNIYINQL